MSNALIILSLLLFLFISAVRREWGIYLTIILLPFYQIRFSVAGVPMTFLETMILLLAATELIYEIREGQLRKNWQRLIVGRWKTSILIFLFLAAAAISVWVSPVSIKAAGIFKAYFAEAVLFYFLVLLIIDSEEKLRGVWQTLFLLVLYLAAFGIYQFVTLSNLPFSWWAVEISSRRITSVLNHPNALALLLGPTLATLLFGPSKTPWRWLVLALGVVALYLSFSRAAWLALIVTVLSLSMLTKHRKKIVTVLLVTILLVAAVPFSRQKLWELTQGGDPSQQNRLVLWSAALDMLKKSPVLGVGLMGFHKYYKNYPLGPDRVIQNYPHNFFLNFWLETGLLGMLSILGLLILFYKKIRQMLANPEWRYLGIMSAAGMLVILLHGMVDVPYFKNDLSVLFWLIYALPFLSFRAKTSESRSL